MDDRNRLMKAKIPCRETGIQIKRTICDICAPNFHCGIDAYVKDGKVIKVEGTKEHPMNHGLLCTKGAANREYIYRKDRLMTPLRRVGERGKADLNLYPGKQRTGKSRNNLTRLRKRTGRTPSHFRRLLKVVPAAVKASGIFLWEQQLRHGIQLLLACQRCGMGNHGQWICGPGHGKDQHLSGMGV